MKRAGLIIFLVLLADQSIKFWVKLNMYLGQDIHVLGDWFIIHFTENKGMAFGLEFAGETGKYVLSIFRILAVILIAWYIYYVIQKNARPGLITALSLIMAGALGNIIDSAFYGVIFNESGNFITQETATLFPESGGYAPFLQGKVVDMFYFPVIQTQWPQWLFEGRSFIFFRPVFNFADVAITVGVFMLLIFQNRYFHKDANSIQPLPKNQECKNAFQKISHMTENREEKPEEALTLSDNEKASQHYHHNEDPGLKD